MAVVRGVIARFGAGAAGLAGLAAPIAVKSWHYCKMPERRLTAPAKGYRRSTTRSNAGVGPRSRPTKKGKPAAVRVPVTRRAPVSRRPIKGGALEGDIEALTKDCRACRVVVDRMDFDRWFRERPKPRTPPKSRADVDSRLSRKNGMVMLPRSFYNEHPAGRIATAVATKKRSGSGGGGKRRLSEPEPERSDDAEFAYRLVFETVECAVEQRPAPDDGADAFTLDNLSDSIESDGLPSDMWEIERIPPRLNARRETDGSYDTIAAELEALMGESTEPEPEPEPIVDGAAVEPLKESAAEDRERFPSIMDILNETPTSTETDARPDKAAELIDCDPIPKPIETPPPPRPKEPAVEEYHPKSVIFRRLTADKQTYDRLVAFDSEMVYSVAINDAKVQLLGAPERIYGSEDLKILLQIVDHVTLNSFNVALKS